MLASCDFKSQVTGEVTIPSRWKKASTHEDAETQTSKLKVKSREVQTDVSCLQVSDQLDKGVGTERRSYQASLEGLQYVYSGVQHDPAKLAAFLEGSKEELLTILHRNAKSSIFDHYAPNWSRKNIDLSVLYTLTSPAAKEGNLQALQVSWNTHGTVVAVAYGRMDTSGWCYSKGCVCVWSLARPDLAVGAPHYTLETETYATAVAFHPTDPCMLAVGTYSGEVVVFPNITESVPREYSSAASEVAHTEPVTVLQWVNNPQELRRDHRHVLCSAGQSGLIVHWSPANKLAKPVAAYSVRSRRHLSVGITALTYGGARTERGTHQPALDGVLLVGLENGEVGRGRTGLLPVDASATAPCTVVPVELDWLESHRGPLQSVCASPFFRHLLLTASSDGSARLYTDLERAPLLSLEPSAETKNYLYDAQFSPYRPAVAAVVSRGSMLHVYDLQRDQSKPAYSTEASADGAAVLTLAFNATSADWLATGDAHGVVRVWRLPTELSQATEQERAALRSSQPARDGAREAPDEAAVRELFGFRA
ncbi:WD domain, G-beta repeat [Novymonas esmeraldas]|uniref:WD domain, G-beta repeat n=1 Tax=Novymonas esmeraldas TaxID=1808958 RepID=A0AAW0EX36_9TRYP